MKSENPLNNNQPKIEILNGGDVYVISGNKEYLLDIARKICVAFEIPEHEIKENLKELSGGQNIRVNSGVFNLKIEKDSRLTFDNRNARGIAKYTEQMKSIMDSVI